MKIDWKSFAIGAVAVLGAQYIRAQLSQTSSVSSSGSTFTGGPGPVKLSS
jgi:hypothetical protein